MAARCNGKKKTFCERKTVKGRYGKSSFFLLKKRCNSVSDAAATKRSTIDRINSVSGSIAAG
jgi:hypothetical protein